VTNVVIKNLSMDNNWDADNPSVVSSYGTGLTRYLVAAGVKVVEVDRSDRQERFRSGKSDPLDAQSAARAALSGKAKGAPRGRDGAVEAIRALMVAKRSARGERTRSINQARAWATTYPPRPTSKDASKKARPSPRSSAV
jgi:hypothetical protein